MEIKNIIVHFPWGAGGNFVRNCLLLDTRYEFDRNCPLAEQRRKFSEQNTTTLGRYIFLKEFYQQSFTQDTWLDQEWSSTRGHLYINYYESPGVKIINWHPTKNVIYVSHCSDGELPSIREHSWLDMHHVFLIPSDVQFIAEIYVSKSPQSDGHLKGSASKRISDVTSHLNQLKTEQYNLLEDLLTQNKACYVYNANLLFDKHGHDLVSNLIAELSLDIPQNAIQELHRIWLSQTKQLYNSFFLKHTDVLKQRQWK
jgi:hypothetical protein